MTDSPSEAAVLPSAAGGDERLLELRGAFTRASGNETALRDINLVIGQREIVGMAGVSGNGQKELGDLILGVRPLSAGQEAPLRR